MPMDNAIPPPPTQARGVFRPRTPRTSVGFARQPNVQYQYTIQPGDTLRVIAQNWYNNPARWVDIFNANREDKGGVVGDPNNLTVGQVIVIP